MSSPFVVLVPVLARPQRALRAVNNIRAASVTQPRILFICSEGDDDEIRACKATDADVTVVPKEERGDWAKKLEHGRAMTTEDYMVLGADDLCFNDFWDRNALTAFERMDIGVLGTQDKGNSLVKRGLHSTHPIVCRGYADMHGTIDRPDLMIADCYGHQFCDNELCQTAMARGCWHFARDVVIEHLHPNWHKGVDDATYRHGLSYFKEDSMMFTQRSKMWKQSGRRARRGARSR